MNSTTCRKSFTERGRIWWSESGSWPVIFASSTLLSTNLFLRTNTCVSKIVRNGQRTSMIGCCQMLNTLAIASKSKRHRRKRAKPSIIRFSKTSLTLRENRKRRISNRQRPSVFTRRSTVFSLRRMRRRSWTIRHRKNNRYSSGTPMRAPSERTLKRQPRRRRIRRNDCSRPRDLWPQRRRRWISPRSMWWTWSTAWVPSRNWIRMRRSRKSKSSQRLRASWREIECQNDNLSSFNSIDVW